jgi:hypothetical protein
MNMPLELGLAVMASYHDPKQHTWCIFEKDYRRVLKSLGDLAGSDVYSHDGRPIGVLRQIANAFVLEDRQLEMRQLLAVYRDVETALPTILKKRGAKSCYEAAVFRDLVYAAQKAAISRRGVSS